MLLKIKPSILFAVWELEPFLKVGGLGEIARSLPRALSNEHIDIRIILPYYTALKLKGQKRIFLGTVLSAYGNRILKIKVYQIFLLDRPIPVYLLQHTFFDEVKTDTFSAFSMAVIDCLKQKTLGFTPDIIHCNDHHMGLIPLLIRVNHLPYKTLFTIHTMNAQNRSSVLLANKLKIPKEFLHLMTWEITTKKFNFLLEGIENSDIVNTVSPTYAKEIMTETYGNDLDEVIKRIDTEGKFFAILNGIDYELKNPATTPLLRHRYSVHNSEQTDAVTNVKEGKERNKLLLQKKFGLSRSAEIPLVGFIGRLSSAQKGIDSLHRMILRWKKPKCQFVVMGQGEESWEERFTTLAAFRPREIVSITTFTDDIAGLINAGCDFIVVPSIFEPCGQVQMNAMRYGAIPIVRLTGGLTDTVSDGVNGFVYESVSSSALEKSVLRAMDIYTNHHSLFQAIRENAMRTDNSWQASARKYIQLYEKLLN